MKLDQPAAIAMVTDSGSTQFQKAIACKRLSMVGTRDAVPALAALLNDEQLGFYARFGLEPIPDPAVDEALRNALSQLNGKLLIGVIHSLGVRRDGEAAEHLGKLVFNSDVEVARAAAASLGAIGDGQAAGLLREALTRAGSAVRPVVARAALVCAERLMEVDRGAAMEMYEALNTGDVPKPVTWAARRAIMADAARP
jgi:HEAT repeat protein